MSSFVSSTSSLAQLQKLFPDVVLIDTRALATVLGIAAKTIRNQGDSFPIRAVKLGRSKLFRLVDAAEYIDKSLGILSAPTDTPALKIEAVTTHSTSPKRKPGRPSHADSLLMKRPQGEAA